LHIFERSNFKRDIGRPLQRIIMKVESPNNILLEAGPIFVTSRLLLQLTNNVHTTTEKPYF
jgi:hypothetical protein